MKKSLGMVAVACLLSGCTTTNISQDQVNTMAQGAGMAAGVGYAAWAKAPVQVNAAITNALHRFCMSVQSGTNGLCASFQKTYAPVISAAVEVNTSLSPRNRDLVRGGCAVALVGLDSLMATHPEWSSDANTVNVAVQFFIDGMRLGIMSQVQ